MTKNDIEINIYGGNIQVLPNVKSVKQVIHDKDGTITIINDFDIENNELENTED